MLDDSDRFDLEAAGDVGGDVAVDGVPEGVVDGEWFGVGDV